MGDYGIKVTRTGKEVWSNDFRDLLLHSNYSMFKYHMEETETMTINAGDTSKTITIAHGLGYVPAFIVYSGDGTYNTMLPNRRSFYTGEDEHIFATADSTNIYIKWKSNIPYLRTTYNWDDTYSNIWGRNYAFVGNTADGTGLDCATRFVNIAVTSGETITSATLDFYVYAKGDSSSNVKLKTYGFDEDNTGDFGSYPLGRTLTSASTTQEQNPSSVPFSFGINVLDIFNEIRGRAGWSSGNAMGFMSVNNGSPQDAFFANQAANNSSTLIIQKSGSMSYSFRVIIFKDKIA